MEKQNATLMLNKIKDAQESRSICILLNSFIDNYDNLICGEYAIIELILDKELDNDNFKLLEQLVIKSNKISCVYYFIRKYYYRNIHLDKLLNIVNNSTSVLYIYKIYYLGIHYLNNDDFTSKVLNRFHYLLKDNENIDVKFLSEIMSDISNLKGNYNYIKMVINQKYENLFEKCVNIQNNQFIIDSYNSEDILNEAVCNYQILSDAEKNKVLVHMKKNSI